MAATQPHPRPAAMLALLVLLQTVCWSLVPALTFKSIPLDIAENSAFGLEHVLVAYKNPALTGLMLEGLRLLTGEPGWPAYVLSQVCIATCLWCVYALGRDVLGETRAAAGTAILLTCYYFNWHTPEFNHDILQMPVWAAVVLCLWKAVEKQTLTWWLLLGLTGALSLYGKLSAAILLITCALWLLIDRRARATLPTIGPWVALAAFFITVAPLAYELFARGAFDTITGYASMRGRKYGMSLSKWVLLQALMPVPMALIMWATGVTARPRHGAAMQNVPAAESHFRRYLLFVTLLPIALSVVLAWLHGAGAKLMWGVPMLSFTGLLLVSYTVPTLGGGGLKRLTGVVACVVVMTSLVYAAAVMNEALFRKKPSRTNWPQQEIALRMRHIWAAETNSAPLRIVAGDVDNWVSSLVALTGGPPASIFTAGNFSVSPWITPDRLRREGTIVVFDERSDAPDPGLYSVIKDRVIRYEEFQAPRGPWSIRIGYVVVPPERQAEALSQ